VTGLHWTGVKLYLFNFITPLHAACRFCHRPPMSLIALMMEAASTFETPLNFYQTTLRNNPETAALCSF
jgi:hypothetical protein